MKDNEISTIITAKSFVFRYEIKNPPPMAPTTEKGSMDLTTLILLLLENISLRKRYTLWIPEKKNKNAPKPIALWGSVKKAVTGFIMVEPDIGAMIFKNVVNIIQI